MSWEVMFSRSRGQRVDVEYSNPNPDEHKSIQFTKFLCLDKINKSSASTETPSQPLFSLISASKCQSGTPLVVLGAN